VLNGAASQRDGIVLGIGDDAAVLDPGGENVVVTTDSLVEAVHFKWGWCSPEDVGFKAVAVNLSDLAAMGAHPLTALVSLTIPRSMSDVEVLEVAMGIGLAAGRFAVGVAGGNVTGTDGPFEVTVTAIGLTDGGRFLTRSGAEPGDAILASGPLGSAAMGLFILDDGTIDQADYPNLLKSFRRPEPRVDIGRMLCHEPGVHCAIDVSDGLLADLGHVLDSSGVGAEVEVELLPIDPESRRLYGQGGPDPVLGALTGGEDYQLLTCMDRNLVDRFEALGMTRIGTINDRKGHVDLRLDGAKYPMPERTGHRHR
ncbi:MAG: thiamine-phosphate kinase, partial [Deltaproteobacteria bacterium]|nr:thiamine-phosphate kinase [Deltaproteobacteria bacterium]